MSHPNPGPRSSYPDVAPDLCIFCSGPTRAREVGYGETCREHGDMIYASALADYEAHPDGVCTETCGCMTLDEIKAKYGL